MIDDATIKRVAINSKATMKGRGLGKFPAFMFEPRALIAFARAIEQLARQEQREETTLPPDWED